MTAVHEELTRMVAALPAEQAQRVLDFAKSLAAPAPLVECGDWTEEDRRAARLHSFLRFQEEHGEEDWGVDYEALREDKACPPPEM